MKRTKKCGKCNGCGWHLSRICLRCGGSGKVSVVTGKKLIRR
jgi:DnaJ-class molecular chaperone